MQARRPMLRMEVPSHLLEFDRQLVNVDSIRSEGEDGCGRLSQHKEPGNVPDPLMSLIVASRAAQIGRASCRERV